MGMADPSVSEPFDKLSDKIPEGTPFFLTGVRTVTANTAEFGKGEMVVLRVQGQERELGVWGAYLLTQAKSIDSSDLNRWWKMERKLVPGFGKGGRPVKAFVPADPPPAQTTGEQLQASEGATVQPSQGAPQAA